MIGMQPSHLPFPTLIRAISRLHLTCTGRPWRACRLDRQFNSLSQATAEDELPRLPFRFDTGVALFAKRTPRPFPPPFLSPPSVSFSDPLSTHHRSRDRASIDGQLLKGRTSGDDAVYVSDYFLCANDGVGAWATRPRGHAGLWSRLLVHFWATEIDRDLMRHDGDPNPVATLQKAYERTLEATELHNWLGTSTVCGAQLHYRVRDGSSGQKEDAPLLYATSLGDCQVMVLRPSWNDVYYKSKEEWHWFDCPRQLGTNSPDTPNQNALVDKVDLEVGDVVLAMTDGLVDNLWDHEIVDIVFRTLRDWESNDTGNDAGIHAGGGHKGMRAAAHNLVAAAKQIALDPFAESPYMERAIDEGLASVGGKPDDISVVAALCVRNE